jgi:hypothetical protein
MYQDNSGPADLSIKHQKGVKVVIATRYDQTHTLYLRSSQETREGNANLPAQHSKPAYT